MTAGALEVAAFANKFTAFAQAHPTLMRTSAVLAGILVVVGGLALGLSAMLIPLAAMIPLAATLGIGFLPLLGIVAAVAAGIIALTAAGVYLYTHWDGIVGKLKALWGSLPGWLRTIGVAMMDGLLDALVPGRLIARIASLGMAAVNTFKRVLGIHSPSRVFAQLGGFMTEGLARGIDGGGRSAVRSIQRVATGVSTAAVAAIMPVSPVAARSGGAPPPPARSAPAPAPVILHYHAAPGEDHRTSARKMMEEIARIRASERRSSYEDD
jgi:hypothetical protein